MTYTKNRIIALIVAFSLVFSIFSILSIDYSYATTKPSKVVGLKWKKTSANYGKLSWKKVKGSKKYEVFYGVKDEQGKFHWTLEKTVKKTSCSVGQNQLYSYYYKVRAINGKQKGKFSSKIKAKLPYSYYTNSKVIDYGKALWHDLYDKQYEVAGVLYVYAYDNIDDLEIDVYSYLEALYKLGWKVELKSEESNNVISYGLVNVNNNEGFGFAYNKSTCLLVVSTE